MAYPATGKIASAAASHAAELFLGAGARGLPDLNSIEQVFAKLKTLLRKAEQRSIDATWQRIGLILQCFTPGECAAYIQNAGYASA
jgi:hypothetical protein